MNVYKPTKKIGTWPQMVVRLTKERDELTKENLHMNVDHSPYEDITVQGYPALVLQRGQVIVKENEFVGEVGAGQFLRRNPIHL